MEIDDMVIDANVTQQMALGIAQHRFRRIGPNVFTILCYMFSSGRLLADDVHNRTR